MSADDVLHCFDAKTGRTIFRAVLAGKGLMRPGSKQGSHLTPCWWAGKVYFSGSAGRHYCLDADTGKLVWDAETSTSKANDEKKQQGQGDGRVIHATPVAVDDVVAIAAGRQLIGYDAADGEVLWRVAVQKGATISAATPWRQDGKGYFICGGKLIDAKSGKTLWEIPRPPGSAPSAVSGDVLVMPNRGGTWRSRGVTEAEAVLRSMTAFRVRPAKYEQLWQLPFPSPHGSQYNAAFVHRGHAYGRLYRHPATGDRQEVFVRVPLDTGKPEILLTGRKVSISGYSPIAFEGRLLHGDASKFLAVGGAGKQEIRSGPGKAANSTSCAYAGGLLYFRTESRTDGRMVCYDLRARAAGKD
jgi:hypothetical protein